MKQIRLFSILLLALLVGSLLSGCWFAPKDGGIISIGRPYEAENLGHHDSYNDLDLVKLTDGNIGTDNIDNSAYAGFDLKESSKPGYIIIDLGSSKSVGWVSVHLFHGAWGVVAPKKIKAAVSNDKVNWSDDVTFNIPEEHWNPKLANKNPDGAWYNLTLKGSGRYVRVGFEEYGWAWLSEIYVISEK